MTIRPYVILLVLVFVWLFRIEAQDETGTIDVNTLNLEELLQIKVDLGGRGEHRTAFNSPVPVDIVTAEDLDACGTEELTEALSRLIPSLTATRPAVSDGSDHVHPLALRGLSTDQLLVLVNGKRRHQGALVHMTWGLGRGSTSVDLNAIPLAAVERVEILRDGAAAQYGSDAISGIINIVLKEQVGNSFSAQYRGTVEGDGIGGIVTNRIGLNLPGDGFATLTAQFRDRESTDRSKPRFDWTGANAVLNGQTVYRYGDAQARDVGLLGNMAIGLGQDTRFYSHISYNSRLGEAAGFYRAPADSRNIVQIYPEGYLPLIAPQIDDFSLTAGLKGVLRGWTLDFSNTHGQNIYHFFVENSLNASMGPTSPTSFDCGRLDFSQNTTNLDVFKAVDIGFLKFPLEIGAGMELRFESFRIHAGEEASYADGGYLGRTPGAQVFPGFQPGNETRRYRNSVAVYLDLEQRPLPTLLLGLAARYENYSDFGAAWNGKISFRYEPWRFISFRASSSTGFRAPSLGQSFFTATATTFVDSMAMQVGTFSVDHPLSKAHGAQDLKPERSVHLSGGFVVQTSRSFSVSLDFFLVNIADRVTLSGNFTPDNSSAKIRELLLEHGVGGARFFTNAVDTRSQGLDLSARYQLDFGDTGKLMLTLGAHANRTRIRGEIKYPDILAESPATRLVFFDLIHRYHLEKGYPDSNLNLAAVFRHRVWSLTLRTIRYGRYAEAFHESDENRTQMQAAKWVSDFDFTWRLGGRFWLSAGGLNVFDVYPDAYDPKAYSSGAFFPYSRFSPYGINGATFYLKVRFGF